MNIKIVIVGLLVLGATVYVKAEWQSACTEQDLNKDCVLEDTKTHEKKIDKHQVCAYDVFDCPAVDKCESILRCRPKY